MNKNKILLKHGFLILYNCTEQYHKRGTNRLSNNYLK